MSKPREVIEYGDFQTPPALAAEVASTAAQAFGRVATVIEPTCGTGTFLKAFSQAGPTVETLVGWEINLAYVAQARKAMAEAGRAEATVMVQDFFKIDWERIDEKYPPPILFAGNPPWVTSADLGKLCSHNLPEKNNVQGHAGMAAMTGTSNFDISEWMLIKIAAHIAGSSSAMAFLVKTAVARKVFLHIARNNLALRSITMRGIDAQKHFSVHVDACLFCARGADQAPEAHRCLVFPDLSGQTPNQTLGFRQGHLVADIETYDNLADIDAGSELQWRSGVKHDAAKIMELKESDCGLINGLGEGVRLPADHLYPMYKSSQIARPNRSRPDRFMLVTQTTVGAETASIAKGSPATWRYLLTHAAALDARQSRVYQKAPRFAIFGVGPYTFKPWKVAIAGLYKNLHFTKVGPHKGKPVLLDDTCYLLGLDREEEADFILGLLTSDVAQDFIRALVFMDNKRPVTVAILNRISLRALSDRLNRRPGLDRLFPACGKPAPIQRAAKGDPKHPGGAVQP
ncbi:MAG: class I SAM-dependent methyltransferase [Desulfobacterales bacterium]